MSPPVFVVDTNVVVAGLITGSSHSPVASVLDAMLTGTLVFLLSPALLDEYRSVLLRPKLAKWNSIDPISNAEKERNQRVQETQGTANNFVQ